MNTFLPVAIIGRACLLPGANSPEALWENVINKKNCLTDASSHDWKIDSARLNKLEDKTVSFKRGAVSPFQHHEMPSEQLEEYLKQDALTQWLCYLGQTALQDARVDIQSKRQILQKTGIIMGNLSYPTLEMSLYAQSVWLNQPSKLNPDLAKHRFMSGYPVKKTAEILGFEGVAFALDAACASALYAIQLACRELQKRRASMMLAGGINAADDLFLHMGFTALNALSPTGQSRPLHCEADGLVPSQGGACVVLKLLENALKDNDKIYGVIRGVGLSNDGAQKGFLAPSREGQMMAMQKAHRLSGIHPHLISHIECHATGTPLGDQIEIDSLQQLFSHQAQKNRELSLGVLKANIGHTITASGAAALINVLSAFEHRLKPPARIDGPSLIEKMHEKSAQFVCHHHPVEWQVNSPEDSRYAAINSFGFGGNNAHLIVSDEYQNTNSHSSVKKFFQKTQSNKNEKNASIAVTGIALRVGNITSLQNLHKTLSLKLEGYTPKLFDVTLPLQGTKFPPADLQKTLGQQLVLLECLTELFGSSIESDKSVDSTKASVIIGMGTDPEITRYSLKWRCEESDAFDVMPKLTSAHVLGCMPNIVTNRLNYQFNIQGPSFSVSDEELSGLCALQLGVDALLDNECDVAIVGGVDLCVEEVHRTAVSTVLSPDKQNPCDAAIVLVLKRLEESKKAGDNIIFVLPALENAFNQGSPSKVDSILGYSHAVSGLLNFVLNSTSAGSLTKISRSVSNHQASTTVQYAAHLPELNFFENKSQELGESLIFAQQSFISRQMQSYQCFMDNFVHCFSGEDENEFDVLQGINLREQSINFEPFPVSQVPNTVEVKQQQFPGPKFSREDLEILSSGKISKKFGDWFKPLDQYERVIRMPEPPLLLADRVLGIDAVPASFERGTIWTETDVKEDSWYLQEGRMPSGVMIESGQADLLLISWLGFDFYNQGKRVYRLLGCELTFYGELPKPGDTLRFDIHIDAHAKQGDIRLFFFHYDCHIDNQLRMKVRHGQAGFFTDQELKDSGGVLWDANSGDYDQAYLVEKPLIYSEFREFSHEKILKFSQGDTFGCFGKHFEICQTHTRTPKIPSNQLLFIHEVTDFDLTGGPWKRGYMRAIQKITPDDWFFKGHFKNDPCMPGTMMLEAGLQLMMMYMTASGCTLRNDGWRFEPVPEKTYKLTCRGQVIPTSKEVIYEIFVYGFSLSPQPVLYADLLGTVDGLKAFHTKIGLKLVPDWPLQPEKKRQPFSYDYYSLMACALGKPSHAFGKMYEVFDSGKRVARLPSPPYHFMSRIIAVDAEQNSMKSTAKLQVEWDIDANAWYFQDNPSNVVPFCVLMEAGLQPCGWLASYLGCALVSESELFYRNLDGEGQLHRALTRQDKVLKTQVTCLGISRMSETLIISFHVKNFIEDECIYEMKTVFGFFPAASFEKQEGLPVTDEQRFALSEQSDFLMDPKKHPLMPKGQLLMIDAITGYWPNQGSKGLGCLRAEKKVNASEWFFKAHFFQDPVQPGSLGIEAMIQVVQAYMLYKNKDKNFIRPVFEPIATNRDMIWKYRGQVTPYQQLISITIDILEEKETEVTVCASLWIECKRIYEAKRLSLMIMEGSNDST